MDVVLSVLQIVGMILLVLVLLVLVLIGIILFSPIKYELKIVSQDSVEANAKVHWLYRLIRARMSFKNNQLNVQIRLLVKKIVFSYDFSKDNTSKQEKPKEKEKKEKKESMIPKIKGMIERIKANYPRFKKMISDGKNKEALSFIKKECIEIVKCILPKKSKVDVVYSTGSPDTTGQVYGAMAIFPIFYSKDFKVLPDFTAENAYLKGYIWGKGKFYLSQIVAAMLRIVFDKNCRRLYNIVNQFMKLIKEDTNQEVNNG